MSDVQVNADSDMGVLWSKLEAQINEIDATMDSWNPETGVKRQFVNDLVAGSADVFTPQVEKLVSQLQGMEETQRYSIYLGFVNGLNAAFQKSSQEWIEAQVAELPKPEKVTVTEEERKRVSSERSDTYAMMRQLFDLATTWKMPGSENWQMPKIRRGGAGKRGPRALSQYDWAIDGNALEGDDNTQAGVATLLGFAKSSELTAALKGLPVKGDDGKDQKLNTSKPPRTFEVRLETPKGKVLLSAERKADAELNDEDEDEDENTED